MESIDDQGNMKNIYLKDSIDLSNIQIISARSGKIIENGKHKQLIENKNLYKEMWDKQNN